MAVTRAYIHPFRHPGLSGLAHRKRLLLSGFCGTLCYGSGLKCLEPDCSQYWHLHSRPSALSISQFQWLHWSNLPMSSSCALRWRLLVYQIYLSTERNNLRSVFGFFEFRL